MGGEWYNGGSRSICSSRSERKSNEAYGCITAFHHFFHFHHSCFSSCHPHHQPSVDSPSRNVKGLVAPRNSLELTEESPLSTNYKGYKGLNITMQVGRTTSKCSDLHFNTSSDIYNSPRTKTPNVVARLMGIDLLPDNLDLKRPSGISVRRQRHSENRSGTRSLPESPRISSARNSVSDIRRLSLQLNREIKHEELGCWRLKEVKRDEESPRLRHNGRKTVKQIKEKVITRRFGMDITNSVENRETGADQNQTELSKVRSRLPQKQNTIRSSPTFVFRQNQITQEPKLLSSPPIKLTHSEGSKENLRRFNRRKKADCESKLSPYQKPNNQNKQRRAFIYTSTHSKSDHLEKKKYRKTPKSNDIFNIFVASSSEFSATERPWKQVKRAKEPERKATTCSGRMYRYEEKLPQEPRSSNLGESTTINGIFSNGGSNGNDLDHLPEMTKLEEEEKRVVAEIERHIVDALIWETVEKVGFLSV